MSGRTGKRTVQRDAAEAALRYLRLAAEALDIAGAPPRGTLANLRTLIEIVRAEIAAGMYDARRN